MRRTRKLKRILKLFLTRTQCERTLRHSFQWRKHHWNSGSYDSFIQVTINKWCGWNAVTINNAWQLRSIRRNFLLPKSAISDHAVAVSHIQTRQIWGIWKLRPAYSPETPNLGQNRWCLVPCDLEIWWMTLENNRAPLLCCFKLCATFHSHRWIQTGVTVRKRPIWV